MPLLVAATGAPLTEHEVLIFLAQLVLLIGVARLLGGVVKRFGQPPVVGELLAGILLGPSVLGILAPGVHHAIFLEEARVNSVVFGVAWLGVIFLLIAIGYETDLAIIARFRKAALTVSAGSLLFPLAVFSAVAFVVPSAFLGGAGGRPLFAPFFALALSVSALPVVAKILQDLGMLRRNFGQITLAAGMTMDSFGWLILAALSGVALNGRLDVASLGRSLAGLAIFLVIAFTFGRWLVDQMFRRALAGGSSVTAALTVIVVAGLLGGLVTQALQLEAILGAFIVGILLGITRHQLPHAREVLEVMTASIFAPVFFAYSGLRVNLAAFEQGSIIAWTVAIVLGAIVMKVVGTLAGARLGGLPTREGLALGSGLSALGAMGIVVAIIGLNLGVLSEIGFSVLVLAAIVTSIVAPQLLKLVVRGWEIPEEERRRLEEENLKERSIILGARRVLIPTRGGPNTAYAARLLAAAFDALEVTVLTVEVTPGGFLSRLRRKADPTVPDPHDVVEALGDLDVRVVRKAARDPVQAIVEESQLGYDLVVVGASGEDAEGGSIFSSLADRILAQVSVPTLVVRIPEGHPVPDELPRKVLVPVTSSISARAAEELAYSIVRSTDGEVLALHVVNRPEGSGLMVEAARLEEATDAGVELLADAAELGARLGVRVRTLVKVAPAAEQAIVEMANSGEFDLLVVGTTSRALTNRPFFGHRVTYIIENTTIPLAIISFPSPDVWGAVRLA